MYGSAADNQRSGLFLSADKPFQSNREGSEGLPETDAVLLTGERKKGQYPI